MAREITHVVKYFNNHTNDNDHMICKWLTDYIHSSYMYSKQNIDKTWLEIKPGFPNETVTGYRCYSDTLMAFAHKTNRILLSFASNHEHDISMYKFKRFLRSKKQQEVKTI